MSHVILNNLTSQVIDVPEHLEPLLRHYLSYEVPGAFFSPAYKRGTWDGRKYLYRRGLFPTGLAGKVADFFDHYKTPLTWEDDRIVPARQTPLTLHATLDTFSQTEPLERAIQQQRGILRLPTGAGKTYLLAALVARLNVPTLIVTHRLDIFDQLVDTLQELLKVPIGQVQGKTKFVAKITVGMLPTLVKCLDDSAHKEESQHVAQFIQSAECLAVDEGHHLGSDTYFELANQCFGAFWRFAFTATPFRTDNGSMLIEACTAGKIVDITASELIERKRLARPYIWFIEWEPGEAKERATRTHQNAALRGTERYRSIREDAIVQHPERNRIIVDVAVGRVHKNKTVLIAVTTLDHSQILYDLVTQRIDKSLVRIADGSVPKEVRRQYLQDLNEGKIKCVIATSVFGEGVNVPALSCLINATGRDSTVDVFQLVGRALRRTPTKTRTIVIDFWDNLRYFKKSALHRWQALEQEPQFVLRRIKADQLRISKKPK